LFCFVSDLNAMMVRKLLGLHKETDDELLNEPQKEPIDDVEVVWDVEVVHDDVDGTKWKRPRPS